MLSKISSLTVRLDFAHRSVLFDHEIEDKKDRVIIFFSERRKHKLLNRAVLIMLDRYPWMVILGPMRLKNFNHKMRDLL